MKKVLENPKEPDKDPTQTERLIQIARRAELFHSPNKEPFASIPVDDHWETFTLKYSGFTRWLYHDYYQQTGSAPHSQAKTDALATIESIAQFDGPEKPVHVRTASIDGNIWVDLANENWDAVKITPDGWEVVKNPPVKFIRPGGMLPLPMPQSGGSISQLKPFLNYEQESDFRLMVGFIIGAYHPSGPYAILILQGGRGTAKSTGSKVIRSLIDPNQAPTRTRPRNEEELAIAAENSRVIALDNLSGAPVWLSDALCRLSTGAGFSKRTLYTNRGEEIFQAKRPIILNGIDDIATRGDLQDRSLTLDLPRIEHYIDEEAFWPRFNRAYPQLLGAVFDAVSHALRNVQETQLSLNKARMLDFARWVTAAEPALGWEHETFLADYMENRSEAVEIGLGADVTATAIRSLMTDHQEWRGTATELIEALGEQVSDKVQNSKQFPNGRTLRGKQRRLAPSLQQIGIEFEWEGNKERGSMYRLTKNNPNKPSEPSVTPELLNDKGSEPEATLKQPDGLEGSEREPSGGKLLNHGDSEATESTEAINKQDVEGLWTE
ncbi:MAG: hypothetical protein K9N46_02230 [Candidatus Marinimicrobia bacterium]|nr:hypothetical protein [Candidatus Neomarinimicrobiota bacterium]MCF7879541.1 hypothetical protein [Candidatus Neomarinimicrobiota bacterium]